MSDNPYIAPQEQVYDLTNCDREPIHALGRVQSYGALLALSSDWIVLHASTNIATYLGVEVEDLIGTSVEAIITPKMIHDIRGRLQLLTSPDSVERMFNQTLGERAGLVDVALHRSGRSVIVEFEESDLSGPRDYVGQVRPMIDRVARADSIEKLCQAAARQMRGLVGFDRVMVYRFEEDETGTVIAEALRPGLEPYLGLRYPASDIPKQARALYLRSLLRIISDVSDDGHAIVPAQGPEGEVLDLSLSSTRAVSPIHREYLKNMGVEASMSVSILKRGKLWGLFACHHELPLVLPYSIRTAAELFGQLFSFVLDQKESDLEREHRREAQQVHDQMMAQIAGGSSITDQFHAITDAIETVVPFDGAVAWIGGEYIARGATPTREEFTALVRVLNTTATGRIFASEDISQIHPPAEDYRDRAAGLLALPVSRKPRDYIVIFRREIVKSVTWAGNPDKPVEAGPNGVRLTPRKSFEAWQEVVRGKSERWTGPEMNAAEALRVTLLEVVLKLSDEALEERSKAQERQELLIAELNHRVRNILNLIRGLINQSKGDARSVAELSEVIGGRIHSLARAHDQITQKNWAPASLHELIRTECEAYLGGGRARVVLAGPDVALDPIAYSTLALVMHELVTNAAKYGALADSSGVVTVTTTLEVDGAVSLAWSEAGGPPIQSPPVRRGFGSTIIERSVPYDLKGEAEVRYDVTGLSARFVIPSSFVFEAAANSPKAPSAAPAGEEPQTELLSHVLILEDNMIIALDLEDMLMDAGAGSVQVASSVRDALAGIEAQRPSYALLDVNLGAETSEPVAKALAEAGVPFAFATGYGEATALADRFPDAPVLNKPFGTADVMALLGR